MIKDMLDTILKIENDSKAKVVEAQKRAQEIKEAAEKENSERLNAARSQAATSLLDSINHAKKEWEAKYAQALSSHQTSHTEFIQSHSEKIDDTAKKVLSIILTPEQKK
jgi:vacuolar-type H+-ATPase subunit H